MPYKLRKEGGGYKVSGPSGDKEKKPTTLRNAKRQLRLLNAIEFGGFKPDKGKKDTKK
jgi:hypothetical protein